VRCVQGCPGSIIKQIPMYCAVNPELGHEHEYTFADKPQKKRVLIIGGGSDGMEAAMVAVRRGHDVTLWDKNQKLGGELLAAISSPGKGEFTTFAACLTTRWIS
jgi:NADPH-dependent 2,4-dienoyl-CoA reductase/sulfur reductase-like enzyme